jgi:hypothetical protein
MSATELQTKVPLISLDYPSERAKSLSSSVYSGPGGDADIYLLTQTP